MDELIPDKWTKTSESMLASLADDSDTYLQKVTHTKLFLMIILMFRCPATVETSLMKCLMVFMLEISE